MSLRLDQKYRLGDFLLEPDKRLLTRGGRPVHLANKPFQVLLYLIEHRERVVPRRELLEQFWEGKDVYEDTLRKSVSAIRKALEDGGNGHPRYIETRWAEGYRYVGPLEELPGLAAATPPNMREEGAGQDTAAEQPAADAPGSSAPGGRAETDGQEPAHAPAGGASETRLPAATRPRREPFRASATYMLALAAVALAASVLGALLVSRFGPRSQVTQSESAQPVRSVVVLPFKSLSPEPESEYLGDGITESLISVLSRIDGLKVVSRGTAFTFKGREIDPREAGRQLGVDAALEGSVLRSGDGMRVEARLVSTRDGRVLLPTITFERPAGDLLAVQDEIARSLATGLGLTEEGQRHLARRHTENVEAYHAHLKGRYFWNMRTREGFEKSRAYFEEAIARDPNYALAYTGLADYYSVGPWFFDIPPREAAEKARAAALKAVEIDPQLPEAYVTLSDVYFHVDWDWARGMEAIERAIEIAPNSAEAHHKRAYRLIALGRADEAVAEIGRALELDPLNVTLNVDGGEILAYARRYDEAIAALRHAIEMEPGRANAHWDLAQVYEQKGDYDAAVEEYLADVALNGRGQEALSSLRGAYAAAGMQGFWRKMLELKPTRPGSKDAPPYLLACFHARLGEADQAFRWLDKAYAEHSQFLSNLKVEPAFDGVRSDPRYLEMLRRLGLP